MDNGMLVVNRLKFSGKGLLTIGQNGLKLGEWIAVFA